MKITVSTFSGNEYSVEGVATTSDTSGNFFVAYDDDNDLLLAVAVGSIESVIYEYDSAA